MIVGFYSPVGLHLFDQDLGEHPPPTVRIASRRRLLPHVQPTNLAIELREMHAGERVFLRQTLWNDESDCFAGYRYVEKNPSLADARDAIELALMKRRR